MYNLQGNDDCIVSFTDKQLVFCDYPRTIFCEDDNSKEVPMPIPYMSGNELEMLHRFLALRVEIGPIILRDIPPKLFNANIMDRGRKPTGYKLVTWEPRISTYNMPVWMPEYTGIANEYHMWLDSIIVRDHNNSDIRILFHWLKAADYIGCDDIIYLIQAYCAYLYVHMVSGFLKRPHLDCIHSGYTKVNKFHEWVRSAGIDNQREFTFMEEFRTMRETHPHIVEPIMKQFVRHRGIRMPREEWGDDDWLQFYSNAITFYRDLPISESERAKLYM